MKTSFIELQPKIWRELYSIYNLHASDSNTDALTNDIRTALEKYRFSPAQAERSAPEIVKLIVSNHNATIAVLPSPSESTPDTLEGAFLTKEDLSYLKDAFAAETNKKIKSLVVALAVYARAHPHHSNWIKYNIKEISYLAGVHKLPAKDLRVLTNLVHINYGFQMRVVGSTQPIACYQLEWLYRDPAPITVDSLVNICDYTPLGIQSFIQNNFPDNK